MVAASLDQVQHIGSFQVPLVKAGFRMVVFSVILMVVVLFFRKGIMGDKEFNWDALARFFKKLFHGKPKTPAVGGDAE